MNDKTRFTLMAIFYTILILIAGAVGGFDGSSHKLLQSNREFAILSRAVFPYGTAGSLAAFAVLATILLVALAKGAKGTNRLGQVIPFTVIAVGAMIYCSFYLGDIIWRLRQ